MPPPDHGLEEEAGAAVARRRYFAYGPDLLASRMESRVGAVRRMPGRAAMLPGYELCFVHGRASLLRIEGWSVDPEEEGVEGAVYLLTEAQLQKLDALEGDAEGGVVRHTMDVRVTDAAGTAALHSCEVYYRPAQNPVGQGPGGAAPSLPDPSEDDLNCMLRGGRALGLSYQRFWRPLPLASGRRGGYCLAYERDMVREAMDEMAGRGPVAWVGPARVEGGWRLRPEGEGAGEGVPLEGVLYLMTEEQLAVLDTCPDGRRRALVGATLLNEDGTPGVCIEEDVLLYVPPASLETRTVPLLPHEVGQVACGACKAGLTPVYRAYLQALVRAANANVSTGAGKNEQGGEEPQVAEAIAPAR